MDHSETTGLVKLTNIKNTNAYWKYIISKLFEDA